MKVRQKEYGFNGPVVQRYKELYGGDPREPAAYDLEKFSRVQGEFYTQFLREAAKQPWFDQTLFVVVADHGARVYGKAEIPLRTYEIPLMIYAPGRLAPRRIDTLTTQIDIAPTVLGLLGLPYEAPFFGVEVLNHPEAAGVALFSHNHDVAVYHEGRIAVLGLGGEIETYRYERSTDRYTPIPEDRELSELGIAYFQTASEMFKDHRYE
jgi:phosphoglycerol transferase MdoB-like AlkP superfamily enzyme